MTTQNIVETLSDGTRRRTAMKFYNKGRLRAMVSHLRNCRVSGADTAIVKMAHDVLMVDPTNSDAKWVMECYGKEPPDGRLKLDDETGLFKPDSSQLSFQL